MKTSMYSLTPQAADDFPLFVVIFLSECQTHALYYFYLMLLVS